MDLKEERHMILDMVAEGKITVEEAKQLLDALEQSASANETDDDFFSTPGMDFHIPEIRMPNIPRIVNRAYRRAAPHIYSSINDLEDVRDELEDEVDNLREEMEKLKEETQRMQEEFRRKVETTFHPERDEDWNQ